MTPDHNICKTVSISDDVGDLAFFFIMGINHHGNHGILSFLLSVLSSTSLCFNSLFIQKQTSALSLYSTKFSLPEETFMLQIFSGTFIRKKYYNQR